MNRIQPTGDHVAVREKAEGFEVVAIGAFLQQDVTIKAGTVVILKRDVGTAISINGESLLIVSEKDILGVLLVTP